MIEGHAGYSGRRLPSFGFVEAGLSGSPGTCRKLAVAAKP
jgi:hypothetical protein